MSEWYFDFIVKWDNEHRGQYNEGFFGLRDFYCYIKHVAEEIKNGSNKPIDEIIIESIETNFDGQRESIQTFMEITGLPRSEKEYIINPIKLVE